MADDHMNDDEYLCAVRKARAESVEFFSSGNRAEREIWVAREFLENLGVSFSEHELVHVTDDPPDVRFRDAAFEIKEIMEDGRRRHAEYKVALKQALEATEPSDLLEPVTPRDITYIEVFELVEGRVAELTTKYAPDVRERIDLLFYVNFDDVFGFVKTPLPEPTRLRQSRFRSVSLVMGRLAGVLMATEAAPMFLHTGGARIVASPRPHE